MRYPARRLMRFPLALLAAAAMVVSAGAQEAPTAEEQARVLQSLSEFAQHYTERIPNFLCIRTTQHLVGKAGSDAWKPEARTDYELTCYGHDEHYKLIAVDGAPKTKVPVLAKADGWIETNGNFGWILAQVFGPKIHPHFAFHGWEQVRGREAMAFAYKIALAESKATSRTCNGILIFHNCSSALYGFHGLVDADRANGELLRITTEADDLPPGMLGGSETVDYARIAVGSEEYLLPVADTFETELKRRRFRNESTYASYRKFGAESVIKE